MNLSLVDLKIDEIIDILLLHPEIEAPPENYRGLAECLTKFKLQSFQNSLESIFSMISAFEGNRQMLEEGYEFYELTDESGGEPDSEELWEEGLEETGGTYSSEEGFFYEFGDKPLDSDEEAKYLSTRYKLKYYEGREEFSDSTLTAVEQNVVLGLILQIKKETGGYNEDFLTRMQDALQLVGFSTPQIWEIMTQDLNPESQRFNFEYFESDHEYN